MFKLSYKLVGRERVQGKCDRHPAEAIHPVFSYNQQKQRPKILVSLCIYTLTSLRHYSILRTSRRGRNKPTNLNNRQCGNTAQTAQEIHTVSLTAKAELLNATITEAIETLAGETDAVKQDGMFKAWLCSASRFYKYSFSNQLLICSQCPNATQVAGFSEMAEYGQIRSERPESYLHLCAHRAPEPRSWRSKDP